MATVTRTWTHSWDNAPSDQSTVQAQGREMLLALKTAMLAAAGGSWSVVMSSNGTTAGASDNWSSVTDINWESNGTAHSYIVLTKTNYPTTGKQVYLTISCSTGPSNQHLLNVWWSSAAPTIDGSPIINDPTQPTSKFRAFSNKQYLKSAVANCKYHIHTNTAGDFIFMVSHDGTGYVGTVWFSNLHTNFDTGDTWPWSGMVGWLDSAKGPLVYAQLTSNTQTVGFRFSDDNAYTNYWYPAALWFNAFGTPFLDQIDSNGSDISGEYYMIPLLWFGYFTGDIAFKGQMVDMLWGPSNSSIGLSVVTPSSGAPTHTLVGGVWIPCGGTTPTY